MSVDVQREGRDAALPVWRLSTTSPSRHNTDACLKHLTAPARCRPRLPPPRPLAASRRRHVAPARQQPAARCPAADSAPRPQQALQKRQCCCFGGRLLRLPRLLSPALVPHKRSPQQPPAPAPQVPPPSPPPAQRRPPSPHTHPKQQTRPPAPPRLDPLCIRGGRASTLCRSSAAAARVGKAFGEGGATPA